MTRDLARAQADFRAALDAIGRLYPDEDDTEALRDTALGETSLEDDIAATLREAMAREAMAEGINLIVAKLHLRQSRLNTGAAAMRAACLQAMQEAGIGKLQLPDMTVGVGLAAAKVNITDASLIPSDLMRHYDPQPDKKAIALALKAGDVVPGAELGNREPYLRISGR